MKVRPILFSTPMVQAILVGKKTQTRRVVMPQPNAAGFIPATTNRGEASEIDVRDKGLAPYQSGDILWVRETWFKNYSHEYGKFFYRADGEEIDIPLINGGTAKFGKADGLNWRPSIFMPKEAARIFLSVTDVRPERLQDISQRDAIQEGIEGKHSNYPCEGFRQRAVLAYSKLWDDLNAKRGYGWDTNPWVWVYTFEPCEKPAGWPAA